MLVTFVEKRSTWLRKGLITAGVTWREVSVLRKATYEDGRRSLFMEPRKHRSGNVLISTVITV